MPVIIAYGLSDFKEKQFWQKTICLNQQVESDLADALKIMNKYDVSKKCIEIADGYISKAKECIIKAPNNEIQNSLLDILDFSIRRCF